MDQHYLVNICCGLVGLLIGAVLSATAIKKMEVKMDQLGVVFGLEGYENNSSTQSLSSEHNQRNANRASISNIGKGDVAGRDLNKSNSQTVQTIESPMHVESASISSDSLMGSIVNLGSGDVAGRDLNKSINQKIQSSIGTLIQHSPFVQSLAAELSDRKQLNQSTLIQIKFRKEIEVPGIRWERTKDEAFDRYCARFMTSDVVKPYLMSSKKEIEDQGWIVSVITPIDNTREGMLLEFLSQREL